MSTWPAAGKRLQIPNMDYLPIRFYSYIKSWFASGASRDMHIGLIRWILQSGKEALIRWLHMYISP